MRHFQPDQLLDLTVRLLQAAGASPEDARVVGEHLVAANLAGHDSHGLIRIPQYHRDAQEGKLALDASVEVVRENAVSALLDAHRTWGQVAAGQALDLALDKARAIGMSAVAVRRCYHVGRVGTYPLRAAREGFIAQVWCNGRGIARVAPWGGREAKLSTNPVAIAIPAPKSPILVDITTSVVAEGKVRLARNKGEPVPPGWILDRDGQATQDPNHLYEGGTILPVGGVVGHKGYGLSMIVDLLGGVLSGSGCGFMPGTRLGNGLFIQLVDPTLFQPMDEFLQSVEEYTRYLQDSPTAPGVAAILLPGDPELSNETQRRSQGIPIDDGTWNRVTEVAEKMGVQL